MSNKGLGRGLSSLIPKKINVQDDLIENVSVNVSDKNSSSVQNIDPRLIVANPYQPRKDFDPIALNDLIESIKEHGIIQPLVVSPKGDKYELIAGERRLRSAMELEMREVPVIIREVSDQKKLELALIENLQREDLTPIESAIAYSRLINEFNLTQDELARKMGIARSTVANTLRYLSLPEEIQDALSKKQISEAHAKYLLGLDSEVKQINIFRKILYNNLSVRETDRLIKQYGGTKKAKITAGENDKQIIDSLQLYLGTKVDIKRGKKVSRIEISFYSEDDFKNIIKKIKS